ncbi:bifunctional adenosylcobinamide kinase/adenosylcobinamide-phosphate guanylyltransferase [uncultured Vibrio sp.]|uniref:bifunctional adenosylcobinamide kinase/adenosylcobinamide-phosphate guanylyltransferase n=1 Tax=uncultured Vibrio sp. TaxID=114054 RepID=UPI00091EB28D|nr:bifunctional adenosylcobinamide kinase/adenosylcobinamide-phosphate guanylyltransferase [uncultured Vibrio sp.]OIQ26277.1 MAG: bifunctional adenosylcobinamide kinase/adenosylcobinamide-phosphate guanylyltransferase [Vibrio sp. MedPE-SWchi]
MSVHLVLGGARSGKSSHAERIAKRVSQPKQSSDTKKTLHYIATALAFDEEMKSRIKHHQQQRGTEWQEHEVPVKLTSYIERFGAEDVVLIDCLTLWLNNVIFDLGDAVTECKVKQTIDQWVEALAQSSATIVLVSNEVGLGVIPLGEVSRLFVDHAGWMNQKIASIASRVEFIAAGLPLTLKPQPQSQS